MATNMFIRFENPSIDNHSGSGEHAGEIEILSWNHGFAQPTVPTRGTSGSGTVEQASHQNLSFTKYLDGATNDILQLCWSGRQIERVTLTCFRADGATDRAPVLYLRVVLQHVIIANYHVSGGAGDVPVENVALDYGTVRYEYIPQKDTDMPRPPKATPPLQAQINPKVQ